MYLVKRTFLRVFFVLEACILITLYLFGAQGIQAMVHLRTVNERLDGEIVFLRQEICCLEQELRSFADPFKQEKIARERLHMARAGDIVFYIDQGK